MSDIRFNIFSTFEEREVVKIKNFEFVKKIEVIDLKTLDRYKKLSNFEIARKVAFIFLFNPVVLVLKITFNLLQMGFDCFSYVFSYVKMAKALANGAKDFFTKKDIVNKSFLQVFELSVTTRVDIFKNLAQDIIFIVRAPIYAIAIQFATFITLLSPYRARKAIAKIERSWNYDLDLSYDYKKNDDFKNNTLIKALYITLLKRNQSIVFYLAPCFQPGSLNDRHVISPLKEDLKR